MIEFIKIFFLRIKYKNKCLFTSNIHKSVRLGKNVIISDGCIIGRNVVINSNTYVNQFSQILSGTIGKYCSIASFCSIGSNNHPLSWFSTSPKLYSQINLVNERGYHDNKMAPVIGNDVWIGTHSIILRGVKIGDGAIIAAGSIVTKDVPPFAVVGGVPAKLLKYRFSSEIIAKLLDIEWWNKSKEELLNLKSVIEKKEDFIHYI